MLWPLQSILYQGYQNGICTPHAQSLAQQLFIGTGSIKIAAHRMANCHLIHASLPACNNVALKMLTVQPGHFKPFPTPRVTKQCFNDLVCDGFWLTHVGYHKMYRYLVTLQLCTYLDRGQSNTTYNCFSASKHHIYFKNADYYYNAMLQVPSKCPGLLRHQYVYVSTYIQGHD